MFPWEVNALHSGEFPELGGFHPLSNDSEKLSFRISERYFLNLCFEKTVSNL